MDKMLVIMTIVGLVIAGFYSFQWYAGTQSVQNISEKDTAIHASPLHRSPMKAKEKTIADFPIMSNEVERHEKGDNIAELSIPSVEQAYTVFWGADEDTLDHGVGMYISEWTTTPDQLRHTVVSGHRDTVFRKLEHVSKGDEIALDYNEKQYIYVVKDIWVTDFDDLTVIVDKDIPTLTLTTCYPFDFIGNATERYIIQAEMVVGGN